MLSIDDALGGNVFYAAGVSLTSPIPGATHLPIKAHAFFNAGNVINKPKSKYTSIEMMYGIETKVLFYFRCSCEWND